MLLDVEMPQLDGHAVLARIKADPRLADIPVVFVTSRVTTDDVVEGLRLGAHDYLRKPFEPSELLARGHAAGDQVLYAAKEGGRDRVVGGPAAGSRPFTPGGQDAARYP